MNRKFYWESWDKEYRGYFRFLIGLIAVLTVVFLTLLFLGNDSSIDWFVSGSLNMLDVPLAGYGLPSGLFGFNAQLFLVDQQFVGGEITLNPLSSYLYFVVLVFGLLVCLTMVSYLGKFWYTVSMGLFMVLIIGLRLELLGLFGFSDQTATIGIFLVYAATSYYFNSFKSDLEIKWRFLSFVGITLVLGVVIFLFSGVPKPFLYLATYSFIPAVVISIIFIFLVSHEIIYGVLRITTGSTSSLNSNNTKHFVILSLVYLLNVALVQMHNSGFIDWDIFYVNAFFLLIVSSAIGFWGLKSREVLYGKLLPFYPYTAYLYCGLLICCYSFITYHFYQQNDVALEVIEDAIVFGHLGYGAMFFVYIIANFINYLLKNLPVYKIAYKEDNLPYFTSRLAGIIVVAALYFSSGQIARHQGIAAFYNSMGDLYRQTDKKVAAKAMYSESSMYGQDNHKANYNLGFMGSDGATKIKAFRNASTKKPSEYAFINLGLEYEKGNQFFEALFAYQDGLKKFPNSPALKNNLALLFNKTDVTDSTLYYLRGLSASGFKTEVVLSNLLSVCASNDLAFNSVVPLNVLVGKQRYDINANLVANLTKYDYDSLPTPVIASASTRLNLISYAYINNLAIRSYFQPNKVVLEMLDELLANEDNGEYAERLLFLKAINMYTLGKVGEAFETLANLVHTSTLSDYYSILAGIWSLEQGSPKLAVDFLDLPEDRRNRLSEYYLTAAYDELGEDSLAMDRINAQRGKGDSTLTVSLVNEAKRYGLGNRQIIQRQSEEMTSIMAKAKQSEATEQDGLTNSLYRSLGYNNPFNEEAVATSVGFFNKKTEDKSLAYEILLKSIEINPYSERLIKLYIDQCFEMNYMSYAESGLMKLLGVLTMDEFKEFEVVFDERKRAMELAEESEVWE